MSIWETVAQARATGRAAALVTVVDTHGSTPRKTGTHMLVYADGRTFGTIGGGRVEHAVLGAARTAIADEQPRLVEHKLTHELAMCCGGRMTFFVEPIVPDPTLIVFGCGHVGAAIIEVAGRLGFDVIAVDDLDENLAAERLRDVRRRVASYEAATVATLPYGEHTYVIIATREHDLDQRLLEQCLRHPSRYLGVIGSPRKAQMQRERLAAKGVAAADIERVRCPIGLDVGAQSPEEIAVAVGAELVQLRRGGAKFTGRSA